MSNPHLRWRLDLPVAVEDAATEWLMAQGATATYREADPPHTFFAYFPPGRVPPDVAGLAAFKGVRLLEAETFADEDWLAKSREGFGRFEVGSRFLVKPLWDEDPVPEGRLALVVNPGLAFGTGGRDILAFDNDPDCGPAMAEFIDLNAHLLDGRTPFRHFVGLLDDPQVRGPYQVLLANILLETIQELLPGMAEVAAPGGRLIASGILAERQDEALVSLVLGGFRPLRVVREGEWIAILAERT
ncbi:MAG: Ribosomal protein L11 methyltransferase [Acidobacteria bacterium ADurb.Bin340]|nr:MAG: Ribosomal protein L11 methyltransferase [Acidobacteria bacterium ADurb.Bin340]